MEDSKTVGVPADLTPDGGRPVTMQDIESIIRGLVDSRVAVGDDQGARAGFANPDTPAGDETKIVQPKPEHRRADRQSTGLASGVATPDPEHADKSCRMGQLILLQERWKLVTMVPAAPIAASQDMSDEEIAAAFALLNNRHARNQRRR